MYTTAAAGGQNQRVYSGGWGSLNDINVLGGAALGLWLSTMINLIFLQ
jgi:hypothetical protein